MECRTNCKRIFIYVRLCVRTHIFNLKDLNKCKGEFYTPKYCSNVRLDPHSFLQCYLQKKQASPGVA
jgi:hypothetical protein